MTASDDSIRTYTRLSPGQISIDGVEIFLDHGDNDGQFRNKRRADAYYMAKNLGYLDSYHEINDVPEFAPRAGMNILELGIFAGGSAVFFDKLYRPRKLVCLDYMSETAPALENYRQSLNHISTYYGTDQANKPVLRDIIGAEFIGPIDLVIDDASHMYEQSRASFEVVFPLMRPGGIYVIEDWTWAHSAAAQAPDHYFAEYRALTNLIFQLVMAHATSMGVMRRVGFTTGLMWVQRGDNALPENFSLSPYETPRGKSLPLI